MTPMHRALNTIDRRRRLAAAASLLWPAVARPQPAPPSTLPATLQVALVPYLSPRAMLGQFEPLRRHLAAALARPVEFYTASSFAALLESVRARQQPLTLLPAHLARIAVHDWGHTLLVRSSRVSPVQLLAARSLGLGAAATLRGRRIGAIDPMSITALMLRRWLQQQQLEGQVTLVNMPHASAMALALARGDIDAMSAAQGQTLDIPWVRPDELVVLAQLGTVLTPSFVALKGLPEADVAALRAALLRYESPNPRPGTSGAQYVDGGPRDLEPYEPFVAEVRRMLAEGPRPPR